MRILKIIAAFLFLLVSIVAYSQNKYEWKQRSSAGFTYRYVTNDPMQTRFYTLKNGLTVILSSNKKEPRIAMRIAVRAGSNTDPKDHTGLAHYLEHLLFKGTDKYGSLDWTKEKPLLTKIEMLYEQYNKTKDEAKRKEIYKEIDRVSGEASKFAIAGEYDKLVSDMGSQGTNAHTWVEETVYEEDIPSNAIDKLLLVQAERFRNPVFRIFHTELEAVYEEKNRGLDNDNWKMMEAMHANLFPISNYGQQTTIGTIEHLKNPSLIAIREYYNRFYVPNNMAIIMSGDLDADDLVKKIDKHFTFMHSKPLSAYQTVIENVINGPVIKEIVGPGAENLQIGFRVGASSSGDAMLAALVSSILYNGKAGLFDLNLNQQQLVLGAYAGTRQYKDYGMFLLAASPKDGQSLEQVKDLLLGQINILKKGDFDESLMKAITANYKLEELKRLESNGNRVEQLKDAFIKNKGQRWNQDVAELDKMSRVTKKEIVDFANYFFGDKNYVLLYKRKGEDRDIMKVEKPPITPVETNAGKQSAFVKNINTMSVLNIAPHWLDFGKDMQKSKIGNAELLYLQNRSHSLFTLVYRFDMGSWNNQLLPVALEYLNFLPTNKYSAEQISKEFYRLACSFNANANTDQTNITISGLQENFDQALALLEEVLHNCKPDEAALDGLKSRLMKSRANNKLNKRSLMQGLMNYATFGANNPFNYVLSDEQIKNLKGEDLVAILHVLPDHKHRIVYYGPLPIADVSNRIQQKHALPASWTACPLAAKFERVQRTKSEVLFTHYDMVQAEVIWKRDLKPYDVNDEPVVDLFNGYYGGGMGSIVFQTIRESKALAYSTSAMVSVPAKKEDPFSFTAYVGCQ
ncbi:MAG TPA: insulinase family protein, partial [Niastella sp.]